MEADTLNLFQLFQQKDVRYLIPTFQRPYVWTQEEQWEPLWNDVRNTAERYLDSLGDDSTDNDAVALQQTPAHFLGAVVLQQEPTGTRDIERRQVIDGQQRLTTLQLLLDATQEVCEDLDLPTARRLRKYVLNDEDATGGDRDQLFKVWPTLTDRDAFRFAMHNHLPSDEHEESRIVQAHDFFQLQVQEWFKGHSSAPEELADALLAALSRLLYLVVIDLDIYEDPHVIFETLNARGTPLLQSDLIKNYMLSEMNPSANGNDPPLPAIDREPWRGDWWREDVQQGRLTRPRVDVFLNYWLVMRRAAEVQASTVFSSFREYSADRSIPETAQDISQLAAVYRGIESINDRSVLGNFLYRWRIMQMGVLTPVLLWLLSSGISQLQLNRCLRAVESYLTRRMVCRMSTRGYNILFLDLLRELTEAPQQQTDEVMIRFLADQTADATLWPSDREVEAAFLHSPLYRLLTRGRLRLVLEGIEEQLRTPKAESREVERNLTIEHVMPQEWRANWSLTSDPDEREEAEAHRDRTVHTIGNLTLVNGRLNPSLSNAVWADKRDAIAEHSVLHLNKDLLAHAGDAWDEGAIETRARRLAKVAAEVWPHADGI